MDELDYMIIDFVKARPFLFNPKDKNYKTMKTNAWESFSKYSRKEKGRVDLGKHGRLKYALASNFLPICVINLN
jgi:hypothetical protein